MIDRSVHFGDIIEPDAHIVITGMLSGTTKIRARALTVLGGIGESLLDVKIEEDISILGNISGTHSSPVSETGNIYVQGEDNQYSVRSLKGKVIVDSDEQPGLNFQLQKEIEAREDTVLTIDGEDYIGGDIRHRNDIVIKGTYSGDANFTSLQGSITVEGDFIGPGDLNAHDYVEIQGDHLGRGNVTSHTDSIYLEGRHVGSGELQPNAQSIIPSEKHVWHGERLGEHTEYNDIPSTHTFNDHGNTELFVSAGELVASVGNERHSFVL